MITWCFHTTGAYCSRKCDSHGFNLRSLESEIRKTARRTSECGERTVARWATKRVPSQARALGSGSIIIIIIITIKTITITITIITSYYYYY